MSRINRTRDARRKQNRRRERTYAIAKTYFKDFPAHMGFKKRAKLGILEVRSGKQINTTV